MAAAAARQRIAVIGSGAIGTYYGARLQQAGHSVSFLARGAHLNDLRTSGIRIKSLDGDFQLPPQDVRACGSSEEIGHVDWVFLSLKGSALKDAPALVEPCLSKDTRVLCAMNGLLLEDELLQTLPRWTRAVFGGMCFICCNRLPGGEVRHTLPDSILQAGLAGFGPDAQHASTSDELEALAELWRGVKVDFREERCLRRGRWKKSLWNVPFNGLSVALGGITIDKIVADAGLRELARCIMDDVCEVANADLAAASSEVEPLGDEEKRQMFTLSDSMGPYQTSTMLDLVAGREMEVENLFSRPLKRALELGCHSPHLLHIVRQVEAIQRMRGL